MSAAAAPRLRILCVHGHRQNSSSFREKTGALRKLLKNRAELVYMSAPHRIPPGDVNEDRAAGDPRSWWFSDVQARSFDAGQECESSLGLEESLEAVRAAAEDLGPFDGILGFSQGAALVAMICAAQEQGAGPPSGFRFAVLVAGFRSACAEHRRFYEVEVALPTLHVFGQDDRVIPEHMSRDLSRLFTAPEVLTHPGGHFVPAASTHRRVYLDFLQRF